MARGFEDKKIILTENQNALRQIDARIGSLKVNQPDSAEIARFQFIREDVLSRMDEAEQAAYVKHTTAAESPAEIKARMEAASKAMEENRDKPSI